MSMPRGRVVPMVGAVAAVSLVAGVMVGGRIMSPADAAALKEPPPAEAVTVPVETRALRSSVVARGDVSYAGAVDVAPQVTGLETDPVVTGHVPSVGDEVAEGGVVLEVVGRPVLALVGELPAYRTLRPGLSGPDVEQLEQVLDRLGYDPGDVDDTYTTWTAAAVDALYVAVGYEPPEPSPDLEAAVDGAAAELDAAEDALQAAEQALRHARDQAEGDTEPSDVPGAAPDQQSAEDEVERAQKDVDDAAAALAEADDAAATPLPVAEVVYVPSLPRRVDSVAVARGDVLDGVAMSISGADLVVTMSVSDGDSELLVEDMPVEVSLPSGGTVAGTITSMTAAEDDAGYTVVVGFGELTPEQATDLRAANVKVTVPVAGTEGEVLAVPLAALTAGPGGESRVEVRRDDGITERIEVEVGLVAEGYAEVTPLHDDLADGDLVVVGS